MCTLIQVSEAIPPHEGKKVFCLRNVMELRVVLEFLSVDDLNQYEIEQMLVDGINCMKDAKQRRSSRQMNRCFNEPNLGIPIAYIISGSDSFRNSLLNLHTSPAFCALMKTSLRALLNQKQLAKLAASAREFQSSRPGTIVYATINQEDRWFVLVSGKLRAYLRGPDSDKSTQCECSETLHLSSDQSSLHRDIREGEIFGGFGTDDHFSVDHAYVSIEVVGSADLLELSPDDLKYLMDEDAQTAANIISLLQGLSRFSKELWMI
jgi:hypothetical protein